jgi:hypothetical protein
MRSRPLTEPELEDVPRKPGAYRILSDKDEFLGSGSSINDINTPLRQFFRDVQWPFTPRKRDSEAQRYVDSKYYEVCPPEKLRFDYELTKTKEEAPELRSRWLKEFFDQHRYYPFLSQKA